jgi:hypothetical protein
LPIAIKKCPFAVVVSKKRGVPNGTPLASQLVPYGTPSEEGIFGIAVF